MQNGQEPYKNFREESLLNFAMFGIRKPGNYGMALSRTFIISYLEMLMVKKQVDYLNFLFSDLAFRKRFFSIMMFLFPYS
jgi:hypothetical protein